MKKLLLALFFLAFATGAEAATCFWVGGAGSWSTSNAASWASSSGGTASTCAATGNIPKQAGDIATFDGSSGAGTITVDSTINGVTIAEFICDAFTGTLDFSVNNPNMTLTGTPGISCSGASTKTLKLGSGTFTLSGANGTVLGFTTTTNLTLNASSSTILINGAPTQSGSIRGIVLGSTALTWGTITISNSGSSGVYTDITSCSAQPVVTTLNLTAPLALRIGCNFTITNAFTWAGTSSSNGLNLFGAGGSGTTTVTVTNAGSTINWAALSDMIFATSAVNATNSFDLKGNNMNGGSITGPSGGGGGHIIGG